MRTERRAAGEPGAWPAGQYPVAVAERAAAAQPEEQAALLEQALVLGERSDEWRDVFVQELMERIPPRRLIEAVSMLFGTSSPDAALDATVALLEHALAEQGSAFLRTPTCDYLLAMLLDVALAQQDRRTGARLLAALLSAPLPPLQHRRLMAGIIESLATLEQPDWPGLAAMMGELQGLSAAALARGRAEMVIALLPVMEGRAGWEEGRADAAVAIVTLMGQQRDPGTLRMLLSGMTLRQHQLMWELAAQSNRVQLVGMALGGLVAMRPSPVFGLEEVARWKECAFLGIGRKLIELPPAEARFYARGLFEVLPLALQRLCGPRSEEDVFRAPVLARQWAGALGGVLAHVTLGAGDPGAHSPLQPAAMTRALISAGGLVEVLVNPRQRPHIRALAAHRIGFLIGAVGLAGRQAAVRALGRPVQAGRLAGTLAGLFDRRAVRNPCLAMRVFPPAEEVRELLEAVYLKAMARKEGPEETVQAFLERVVQPSLGRAMHQASRGTDEVLLQAGWINALRNGLKQALGGG